MTRRLAWFALASVLLANAALAAFGWRSAAGETRQMLRGVQGADSWRPMKQAYAIAPAGDAHPLYQRLFFEGRIKFIYPPTSLLLFRALDATLPERAWPRALNLLSALSVLLAIGGSVWLLDRGLARAAPPASAADRAARALIATLIGVTFYPVVKAYTLGQVQALVNACFAAMLVCFAFGWRGAAGLLVAAMAALKPHYGLLLAWGLVRREWRFVAFGAAAGLALLGLSVASFGLGDHLDYLRVVAHVGRHGEAYWPNQTLNGFLHRLLGNGESARWDPHVYPPFHALVHAGTLASSAALLGLGLFWPPRARARGDAIDLAGFALALTLASPLAWEHHYGVLLPIFALALPALVARRTWRGAGLPALALCAWIASHHWDALGRLSGTVWNPLQSSLLAAALVLLALLLSLRRDAGSRVPVRRVQ